MVIPLNTLACFNNIQAIEPIAAGLSSQCYQVSADNKLFFAKQVTTTRETNVSLHAASQNISPRVIFHDKHWLITEFIDGENLAISQHSINDKISITIKLMAKCHQIVKKPVELHPKSIAYALIKKAHFSNKQQDELLQVANQLTSQLEHTKTLVCCHGDLNFSNILINQDKNTYLVDFECACTAPVEYDLAMFIAVNNLEKNKTAAIIECYKKHSLIDINLPLLNHYLLFCYFINGLWYTHAYSETNLLKFTHLVRQQWQHINGMNILSFCH